MDQHGDEEEEAHSSEDSRDHQRKDDVGAAVEGGMNNHRERESMDHQLDGGYEEAEETAGVLKKVEVVAGTEEAPAPVVAHPCSLLQLLLRPCAGCLGLHGYCRDDDDPKPAASDDDDDAAAAAVAETPKEGEGGGDKAASYFCMQEVGAQVPAVRRRPAPPGRPREGPGGDGGKHN